MIVLAENEGVIQQRLAESIGSNPAVLGRILNQDNSTLGRVQRGLKASAKPGVTTAHYEESRIRHFSSCSS